MWNSKRFENGAKNRSSRVETATMMVGGLYHIVHGPNCLRKNDPNFTKLKSQSFRELLRDKNLVN